MDNQKTNPGPPIEPLPTLPRSKLGDPSSNLTRKAQWLPPAFLIRLGLTLRHMLITLANSFVPPSLPIFEHSTGMMQTMMLALVARHAIADRLEQGGKTAQSLAAETGTDAAVLHRMLRALASRGIFALSEDGSFTNNRLSRALLSGAPSAHREWAQYFGSQSNILAWSGLDLCLADGRSSFDRIFGMTVWDWFEKHGDEQAMFAHSMMGVTSLLAPIIARLYPFQEVKTVCDVGGGRGTLLSEVLLQHSHLKGLLYDAAGVLESADLFLKQKGLHPRTKGIAGNFFRSIPSGAEIYLLKNILHDWNDEQCNLILSNLKRAMASGQKVLVIENCVETNSSDSLGTASDMQMLIACSEGRERSSEEIFALLLQNGFQRGRFYRHPLVGIAEGIA